MKIGNVIAYNLKRIREERKLSLGQLADMAGVSKVVLSQIEKGDANPTINTIWKITGALNLPYTSLLENYTPAAELVKKSDIAELVEDKYHIFNFYSKNQNRNFEMYQIEMEPGCVHNSIGHSAKSYEYIMMIEGEITLSVNNADYAISGDEALCFEASAPHRYRNNKELTAKAMLLIQYL